MLPGDVAEKLHYLSAAKAIQRGRWFVSQQDAGMIGQCPGNSDALLLATGKHRDFVIGSITNSEGLKQFLRALPAARCVIPLSSIAICTFSRAFKKSIKLDF
jgi:hypothetical protein